MSDNHGNNDQAKAAQQNPSQPAGDPMPSDKTPGQTAPAQDQPAKTDASGPDGNRTTPANDK